MTANPSMIAFFLPMRWMVTACTFGKMTAATWKAHKCLCATWNYTASMVMHKAQETIEAFEDLRTGIGRNPDRDSTGPLHGPGVVAVEDVDIDGAQHVEHIDQRRGRFLLARDADERLHVRKRTSAEGASVSCGSSATVHPCAALAG